MNLTPMLLITHKLTAINNPTPLLLKARDSSKIIPAYPTPNSNAIAASYIMRTDLFCNAPLFVWTFFNKGM